MATQSSLARHELPFKAVRLQCLDLNGSELSGRTASGCIRREEGKLFLYTCWHVVTGLDPYDLRIGVQLPLRRFIEVLLQSHESPQEGVVTIGGSQRLRLPLYTDPENASGPLWWQEVDDVPNPDLNAIGIRVPFWHDVVKLPLPPDFSLYDLLYLDGNAVAPANGVHVGEKILFAGYPYGYSALGLERPTPIVISRHVVAVNLHKRRRVLLLDGGGAPGMSGGPAFLEREGAIWPIGFYTGIVFPDFDVATNERSTSLGTVAVLSNLWNFHPKLVPYARLAMDGT